MQAVASSRRQARERETAGIRSRVTVIRRREVEAGRSVMRSSRGCECDGYSIRSQTRTAAAAVAVGFQVESNQTGNPLNDRLLLLLQRQPYPCHGASAFACESSLNGSLSVSLRIKAFDAMSGSRSSAGTHFLSLQRGRGWSDERRRSENCLVTTSAAAQERHSRSHPVPSPDRSSPDHQTGNASPVKTRVKGKAAGGYSENEDENRGKKGYREDATSKARAVALVPRSEGRGRSWKARVISDV